MFVRARTAALGTLCTPYLRGFKPQEGGNDDLVPLKRPDHKPYDKDRGNKALCVRVFVVNMFRTT
jgi:hypothetical protein